MALLYVLLVLIWSTGFITGKFLVGLIDPNIYLTIRFLGVGGLFTLIAVFQRRRFPSWNELPKHIIAGMLMNGFYLAFAYVAIAKGLPAGIMALIGALQPALVTLLAFLLIKEKTSIKGIIGMLIGMVGLVLVLSPVFELDLSHGGVSFLTLLFACLGILSLSLGVTYQKMSISSSDLFSSMAIQNLAAAAVTFCFALVLGEHVFKVQLETFALIAWGIIVLSCGGVFLMVWLLRKVKASQVTTVMLLVPPLAAVESYFLFNEHMTWVQITGFVVTIAGVYLSRAKPA
ncbi:putative DMT superfamily transporter inner membrane protein [Marinomonas spartinae]|uniref:Putative DMT superfamily transporter inner membrane protein n=1 Tax=Marinomonas spartinae TaxID=1792290 RepID=A0A1A8TSX8_9GAMM|nr:DMT family transporter [Marinomonas spartinae]SBS36144.1 putative DMT superfamily transporter inner membrane protein [Marinomonas spartinae]